MPDRIWDGVSKLMCYREISTRMCNFFSPSVTLFLLPASCIFVWTCLYLLEILWQFCVLTLNVNYRNCLFSQYKAMKSCTNAEFTLDLTVTNFKKSVLGLIFFLIIQFSDFCLHLYCYIRNVSADVSSGLLQVFLVELENLRWNFEPWSLFNPWGSLALIPFTITRFKCWVFL